jgi:very-short-patch-repair endonuclease
MRETIVMASEAIASGRLTRRELDRDYTKLFRNVYARNGVRLTARDKAIAGWLWSGRSATLAGCSAAAVLGSRWLDGSAPAELIRANRRAPDGICVYSDALVERDVCRVGAMRVTTPARTAFDIARRHSLLVAVPRIDALLRVSGCTVLEVSEVLHQNPGLRGVRAAAKSLGLADAGAESPPESLVRLLVLASALPRPVTQIDVCGMYRLDMGWPELKVAIEYDGAQHWTDPHQRARDIERLESLTAQGWTIIRVSWTQLRDQPKTVVNRIAEALGVPPNVTMLNALLDDWVQELHVRRAS